MYRLHGAQVLPNVNAAEFEETSTQVPAEFEHALAAKHACRFAAPWVTMLVSHVKVTVVVSPTVKLLAVTKVKPGETAVQSPVVANVANSTLLLTVCRTSSEPDIFCRQTCNVSSSLPEVRVPGIVCVNVGLLELAVITAPTLVKSTPEQPVPE
jgi:hypothetical protein